MLVSDTLYTHIRSFQSARLRGRSPSVFSTSSYSSAVESTLNPDSITERIEDVLDLSGHSSVKGALCHSSPPSVLVLMIMIIFYITFVPTIWHVDTVVS